MEAVKVLRPSSREVPTDHDARARPPGASRRPRRSSGRAPSAVRRGRSTSRRGSPGPPTPGAAAGARRRRRATASGSQVVATVSGRSSSRPGRSAEAVGRRAGRCRRRSTPGTGGWSTRRSGAMAASAVSGSTGSTSWPANAPATASAIIGAAEAERGATVGRTDVEVHLERRRVPQRDLHGPGQPAEAGQPAGDPAAVRAAGRAGEPGRHDHADRVGGAHRSRA